MLPKHAKINKHTINLEIGKQLPYELIHNLKPVQLDTLKTYIEINLANGFIRTSKSLIWGSNPCCPKDQSLFV